MSLVKVYSFPGLHKNVSALVRELLATSDAVQKEAFVSVLSRHALDSALDMNAIVYKSGKLTSFVGSNHFLVGWDRAKNNSIGLGCK